MLTNIYGSSVKIFRTVFKLQSGHDFMTDKIQRVIIQKV